MSYEVSRKTVAISELNTGAILLHISVEFEPRKLIFFPPEDSALARSIWGRICDNPNWENDEDINADLIAHVLAQDSSYTDDDYFKDMIGGRFL